MTENKRFSLMEDGYYDCPPILDNGEELGYDDVLDMLNQLNDENEELKQAYTQLRHRHSLLHDVCIDAECDRDSYRKDVMSLEKENEQLKSALIELKEIGDYQEKRIEELNKNEFICLTCEHGGYAEIGCLCEKQDHWVDFTNKCKDFKELRE